MKKAEQSAGEAMSVATNTIEVSDEVALREELHRLAAENAYYKNRVLVLAQLNATAQAKLVEFEAKLSTAGGKAN